MTADQIETLTIEQILTEELNKDKYESYKTTYNTKRARQAIIESEEEEKEQLTHWIDEFACEHYNDADDEDDEVEE